MGCWKENKMAVSSFFFHVLFLGLVVVVEGPPRPNGGGAKRLDGRLEPLQRRGDRLDVRLDPLAGREVVEHALNK